MRTRPNDSKCKYYGKHLKLNNNPKGPGGKDESGSNRLFENCFLTMILFVFAKHRSGWKSMTQAILSPINANKLEEMK